MKIGILTFHWGTNYGAILQAYCLQEYLAEQGHNVEIINYKPSSYDFSWLRIARHPSLWKTIRRQLVNREKEALLVQFREKYLNCTKRYYSASELTSNLGEYNVIISGSDQVLNPGFTLHGDNGSPSFVYWLKIDSGKSLHVGYAVSFGCEKYPENAMNIAKQWVNCFDIIGTREHTGLQILDQLGYKGSKGLIPDPTILIGARLFNKLGLDYAERCDYICVYMLRHEIQIKGEVRYIDDRHKPLTMEQWLKTIVSARGVITNSYHGMIVAMFAHVPFAVLLETKDSYDMNDRFFTLLGQLSCKDRVAYTVTEALSILQEPIDFVKLDTAISEYGKTGADFLEKVTQHNIK
jgi:hypothetical protein